MSGFQRRTKPAKYHVYGLVANGVDPASERGLVKQVDLAEYRVGDAMNIRWAAGKTGWPALAASWQRTYDEAAAALARLRMKEAA